MIRLPPVSTRTDTYFPYPTLFRSRELPAGQIGEGFLRPDAGPGNTYHYVGAAPRRAEGGYETIGDYGWLDNEGYLFLADRRTDLIISGGANIYPAAVESALMEHPDVDIAVVIGLTPEARGRSEERRVGKGCVSTCSSWWSPYPKKKKTIN